MNIAFILLYSVVCVYNNDCSYLGERIIYEVINYCIDTLGFQFFGDACICVVYGGLRGVTTCGALGSMVYNYGAAGHAAVGGPGKKGPKRAHFQAIYICDRYEIHMRGIGGPFLRSCGAQNLKLRHWLGFVPFLASSDSLVNQKYLSK